MTDLPTLVERPVAGSIEELLAYRSGLMDALPASIDHAVVGAAEGLGRNGWGAALLKQRGFPDDELRWWTDAARTGLAWL